MLTPKKRVNLSSIQPNALATFYRKLGVTVQVISEYEDSQMLGDSQACICIWDENRWGKSGVSCTEVVLQADDLWEVHRVADARGIPLEQSDGEILSGTDPDGNRVICVPA